MFHLMHSGISGCTQHANMCHGTCCEWNGNTDFYVGGAFIPDVQILITTLRHICFANISNSDSKFHLDLTEWRVETKLLKERASTRDSIPRHLSCNPLRLKTLQPQNKKPGQSLTWRHWLNNRDGPHPGWFAAQLVANETEAKPHPLRVKRSGYQRQAKGVHNRKCTRRITNKSAHTHIPFAQAWKHKRIHKCHSQLAISLRTGGTLPPHHLRVLFITVWQHVSSSPRHYATLHWYSPTVQQPGTQHNHAKNMTLGE